MDGVRWSRRRKGEESGSVASGWCREERGRVVWCGADGGLRRSPSVFSSWAVDRMAVTKSTGQGLGGDFGRRASDRSP